MSFATCRACDRAFTKDRWGSQSSTSPRLCCDCERRERAFHPHHSPQAPCIGRFLAE